MGKVFVDFGVDCCYNRGILEFISGKTSLKCRGGIMGFVGCYSGYHVLIREIRREIWHDIPSRNL